MKRVGTRFIVLASIVGIVLTLGLTAVFVISAYRYVFAKRNVQFIGTDERSVSFSKDEIRYSSPPIVYESNGFEQIEPLFRELQAMTHRKWHFLLRPPGEECGLLVLKKTEGIEADLSLKKDDEQTSLESVNSLVHELGVPSTHTPGTIYGPTRVTFPLQGGSAEIAEIIQRILKEVYAIGPGDPLEIQSGWRVPVPG